MQTWGAGGSDDSKGYENLYPLYLCQEAQCLTETASGAFIFPLSLNALHVELHETPQNY